MWQVIGTSVRGTDHLRMEMPCQDAHAFCLLPGGVVIAAVADGLGSAARSDVGAQLAVNNILQYLEKTLSETERFEADNWSLVMRDAFHQARVALAQRAQDEQLPLRDYGTTLLTAALGSEWVAIGHIGDGAIVMQAGDLLSTLSPPMRGTYANEVTPLTMPDALERARFLFQPVAVEALALLTDGLQSIALDLATGNPYAPFFAPFFDGIASVTDPRETSYHLTEFLASERVTSRTQDDKTLVVIGRKPIREERFEEVVGYQLNASI